MKLLIVDADRDLVEMLTGWLKTLGHDVRRAYSGKQARLAWEDQKPDLVLLDPSLHDTDALAMCREMQRRHVALGREKEAQKAHQRAGELGYRA